MSNFKIGIIGASVTSCILGIYVKKRGNKAFLLEKGNKVGGAWEVDKLGSIFSNIVSPISNLEKKNFNKILKFLKKFKIKFNKNFQKALFTKEIVNVQASDFRDFINFSKKKLTIKYKFKVKKIREEEQFVSVNDNIKFDYIFYPTNVYVPLIYILKNKKTLKISDKINVRIKSKHLRFFSKDLNVDEILYNEEGVGPLDRLQIFNDKNNIKIINGRIKMNWKKKENKKILDGVKKALYIDKIDSPKFSYYNSEKISKKNLINLIKNLKKSKRVMFINTNSITEFVLENFIKTEKNILWKIFGKPIHS